MKEYIKHGLEFSGGWALWIATLFIAGYMFSGAKPQRTTASIYNNHYYINAVFTDGETRFLTEEMLPDKREGVVELVGDEFIPQTTQHLHLSGSCEWKHPVEQARMLMILEKESYILADTDDQAYAFDLTIPAQTFKLQVSQSRAESANGMNCNILIQAVK